MPVLNESQRSRIQSLITYLEASGGGQSAAGNQRVAEDLSRALCDLCPGWFGPEKCANSFQITFHNAPVTTLLRAILCISDSCV